ncbi:MAG: Mth938-like domain-containing protein [Solirubrobacterales bacterium]
MDITPVVSADRQLIQGYGDNGFTVTGTRYDGSVVILPDRTHPWRLGAIAELTVESLTPVLEAEVRPEILLIGCGRSMAPIPRDIRFALKSAGIVVEPMDTGAACRTYNVLITEDRRVAAALIAV